MDTLMGRDCLAANGTRACVEIARQKRARSRQRWGVLERGIDVVLYAMTH
jgi:hypothetical protein